MGVRSQPDVAEVLGSSYKFLGWNVTVTIVIQGQIQVLLPPAMYTRCRGAGHLCEMRQTGF